MAEAVVEEIQQPPQRFYCHLCSVEIANVTSEFTCPHCSKGFIEELPPMVESHSEDVEMTDPLEASDLDEFDRIREELASLLMARTGASPDSESVDSQQNAATGRGTRRNRRQRRIQDVGRFDVLVEVINTLTTGTDANFPNTSMLFLGNPGDYAWGREGVDTIVTQLLNQLDITGPPPLSKEKIEEIPKSDITEDQVEHKLQCSVCWEDFRLGESVLKLPCLHVYHEGCIVPWLKLHGTCPICRKSLTNEQSNLTNSIRNATSEIIRRVDDFTSPSNNSSVNTASTSSQSMGITSTPTNLNSIPFSFFSQPGTTATSSIDQSEASNTQQRNNTISSSNGRETSGNENSSNNTRDNVYRYDDGNIEYDFD